MCSSALAAVQVSSVVPVDGAAGWRVTVSGGNQGDTYEVDYYRGSSLVNRQQLCKADSNETTCSGVYRLPVTQKSDSDYLVINALSDRIFSAPVSVNSFFKTLAVSSDDSPSCTKYASGTDYAFNQCAIAASGKDYFCKVTSGTNNCSNTSPESSGSPSVWSSEDLYPLPKGMTVNGITITTPTTATGRYYKIYANAYNEAPLVITVNSGVSISPAVLEKSVHLYNKHTGLPFTPSGLGGVSLNYTNNGYDAAIPQTQLALASLHSKQEEKSNKGDSENHLVTYLTSTKPSPQISVCARVYTSDGNVIDTCGAEVDAPALIDSINAPIVKVGESTACSYSTGSSIDSDSAGYYKFTLSINGIQDNIADITAAAGNPEYNVWAVSLVGRDSFIFSGDPVQQYYQSSTYDDHVGHVGYVKRFNTWATFVVPSQEQASLHVKNIADGYTFDINGLDGNAAFVLFDSSTDSEQSQRHHGITYLNFNVKMIDLYGNHVSQDLKNLNMYCHDA